MKLFSSLTRSQKESVGLLQIGTFLEYFDLMLYVHMAVLLNDLFFPKNDPYTASLLMAFTFCSTYVLRPFGALIFGYIGDNIGRKSTVLITTAMMAFSCVIMANLPTYDQIGITAAWIVTLCRIMQGLSSMGEMIGAEVYLTEITKPPERYPLVALIAAFSVIGSTCALGVATFVIQSNINNWRIAFWVGTSMAIFGTVARTRLRETPDFLEAKQKRGLRSNSSEEKKPLTPEIKKTLLAYFLIFCPWPLFFYFSYIYCGDILKHQFGFTPQEVITQNLVITLIDLAVVIPVALLSYRVFPIKILKLRHALNFILILFLPYVLSNVQSSQAILVIQVLLLACGLSPLPAFAIFYEHFPILKRFTYATFIYALSRTIMYVVSSFGLILITKNIGLYGIWILMFPLSAGFIWGVKHFEKLEHFKIHSKTR